VRIVVGLLRLAVSLALVLALVVGVLSAAITFRALPQTSGTLEVDGLEAPVTVIRDDAGIARIYADSPQDLFFAQGFVHAQERMWQMEVWRHISAGRLSELFGRSTLETDRFIRTLGWRLAAARDLEALSDEARNAAEAYADGVNAWLDTHGESLSLPFVVTGLRAGNGGLGGYDVEPWTPLDSLAFQKVQAWNLGGNMSQEIFRMLADEHLGDAALTDELFPAYRKDAPVITPADRLGAAVPVDGPSTVAAPSLPAPAVHDVEVAEAWRDVAAAGGRAVELAGLSPAGGLAAEGGIGSNGWVVGPELAATGEALLANDPHLGIGMPSVWFMNGLHCRRVTEACPYDVAGVSFPGTPAVVLGHNARVAWGATNVDPDVQDLFVERIDPEDPTRYILAGESVAFELREERIEVAGAPPEVIEVRATAHGPILNDVDPRLEDADPVALRWTALSEVDGTFEAIFRLNTAASFDDFRAALAGYGSPSQNFVYADVDGHIGYQLPGLIPIRAGGATGSRPVRGDDGEHEWTGYVPFDQLPWQYDPPGGVIVTANNAPVDAAYPYRLGSEWDPGYRAARIIERLAEAAVGGITSDEMRAIQSDTIPLRASRLQAALAELPLEPETGDGSALLELIREWAGSCSIDNRGCAAYHAFEYRLIGALFEDELGPLSREYVGGDVSFEATMMLIRDPEAGWWDDTRTDVRESALDIAERTLDATAKELRDALGAPEQWTWGALHGATFREETLGTSGIGPLEWYLNRGPVPAAGAPGAVLNTYHRPSRGYPDPYDDDVEAVGLDRLFDVAVLPSYRLTIDMGDLDAARIIQTTGQSGNPFDAHYGDLIDRWATGETLPLRWDRETVEDEAAATLELEPAGS
jgi:penicillin amidase